jgi:hypothetical protein
MTSLFLRSYSAWITVNEEPAPVYQEETTGTVCSAWIASTAGQVSPVPISWTSLLTFSQCFSVWWKDDSKARIATSGHIFIDGHDVASAIMRPGRSKPVERKGAKTSARRLKPFTFSRLLLTGRSQIFDFFTPFIQLSVLHRRRHRCEQK